MKTELSLIVPTYNEVENVGRLFERVHAAVSTYCRYEVLVMDDNSPDGTADEVRRYADRYPVRVIVRTTNRGLAPSIVDGLKLASGQVIGVIDADLQHPPEKLPELLNEVRGGADVVVASRYEAGGGIEGWTLSRKIVSRGARLLAYVFTPSSKKSRDPLSGFFLLKKSTIEGVELRPIGYKILLEILVRGNVAIVGSVPYSFADREAGQSKYGMKEQVNYLRHLLRLIPADRELRRFLKFCLVGGSGVLVNMGLLWLLTEVAGLFYLVSSAIAVECAIVNNFAWNEVWTFRDRGGGGSSARLTRLLKFNLVSVAGLGINVVVLWLMTDQAGMYYMVSNLFGIAAATFWNFMVNARWTWRSLESSIPEGHRRSPGR